MSTTDTATAEFTARVIKAIMTCHDPQSNEATGLTGMKGIANLGCDQMEVLNSSDTVVTPAGADNALFVFCPGQGANNTRHAIRVIFRSGTTFVGTDYIYSGTSNGDMICSKLIGAGMSVTNLSGNLSSGAITGIVTVGDKKLLYEADTATLLNLRASRLDHVQSYADQDDTTGIHMYKYFPSSEVSAHYANTSIPGFAGTYSATGQERIFRAFASQPTRGWVAENTTFTSDNMVLYDTANMEQTGGRSREYLMSHGASAYKVSGHVNLILGEDGSGVPIQDTTIYVERQYWYSNTWYSSPIEADSAIANTASSGDNKIKIDFEATFAGDTSADIKHIRVRVQNGTTTTKPVFDNGYIQITATQGNAEIPTFIALASGLREGASLQASFGVVRSGIYDSFIARQNNSSLMSSEYVGTHVKSNLDEFFDVARPSAHTLKSYNAIMDQMEAVDTDGVSELLKAGFFKKLAPFASKMVKKALPSVGRVAQNMARTGLGVVSDQFLPGSSEIVKSVIPRAAYDP
jgi:hypothetical protein